MSHTKGPWSDGQYPWDIDSETDGLVAQVETSLANYEDNWRLIVFACNSYDRHFGPRAVEAAEADVLGKALEQIEQKDTTP